MTRRPYRSKRRAGLTIWRARAELERVRRRQLLAVELLAAISVLLCLPWLSVEWNGDSTLSAWLVFEAIVLAPLAFGIRRVNRVSALIARADSYSMEEQTAEADALRATDESIRRASSIAASLHRGAAREQAQEALAAAERAALVLRPLVRRRTHLQHLLRESGSPAAAETLRTTLDSCEGDIRRLESQIADITASVAMLVDAADDPRLVDELDHLRSATEDVRALISAFEDIAAVEDAAGLRSG